MNMQQSAEGGKLDGLLVRLSQQQGEPHVMEQLGLLYVGTYASRQGYRVRVLDRGYLTLPELLETAAHRARVVGFYVDAKNVTATMKAIQALKAEEESLLLVAGGPQASVPTWDERLILEAGCDIAVRGEGEFAFSDILDWYLRQDGLLQQIEGISFVEGGKVRRTVERQLCQTPDLFPVPDRTLNHDRRKPGGTDCLITSRGCPNGCHDGCAFCHQGKPETGYRPRKIPEVLAEVEMLLASRRPACINIFDDTFTVDPGRVQQFCEGMRRLHSKYYPVRWLCEGRAQVIVQHPELMRDMVAAGLDRIRLGVETGNQHPQDGYRKRGPLDEIREAVRICCEADVLSIFGNFVIGGAFESWESIERSIEFAKELLELGLGRLEVNSTVYTPNPGAAIYNAPGDFGLELADNYAFVRTRELSSREILQARQRFLDAVSSKMNELYRQVPDQLLQRHCQAYYLNGLKTNWYDLSTGL
jgi:anaerobic magnesium-protoporphyrin IX monomethyl ester cyclase